MMKEKERQERQREGGGFPDRGDRAVEMMNQTESQGYSVFIIRSFPSFPVHSSGNDWVRDEQDKRSAAPGQKGKETVDKKKQRQGTNCCCTMLLLLALVTT